MAKFLIAILRWYNFARQSFFEASYKLFARWVKVQRFNRRLCDTDDFRILVLAATARVNTDYERVIRDALDPRILCLASDIYGPSIDK